jgi:hypothetical protein
MNNPNHLTLVFEEVALLRFPSQDELSNVSDDSSLDH